MDEGNGKFNLMLLCWGEGHSSAVHDHADAHCFMKMLDGHLKEVRFAWPDNSCPQKDPATMQTPPDDGDAQVLRTIGTTVLEPNGVCYINGTNKLVLFFPFISSFLFTENVGTLKRESCLGTFVFFFFGAISRWGFCIPFLLMQLWPLAA